LDLANKAVAKNADIPEKVLYWHWINDNILGVVGDSNVYHLDLSQKGAGAIMIFAR